VRRAAPRPLAAALPAVTEAAAPPGTLALVQREWQAAVGAAIAAEAEPVEERNGTIMVVCGSAVWAQELELLRASLLQQLNGRIASATGHQPVKELRFAARGTGFGRR
jgi:predicted nucleic acid-binding Zn ribbon protein